MFLFSAGHRRGHLTSGIAAAKALLGPGCVEGVIKGEKDLGGGTEGWAAVTAAEERQPERVGAGARAKAARRSLGLAPAAERGAAA